MVRYVYGVTAALLLGGTGLALASQSSIAQDLPSLVAPATMQATSVVPRAGAPNSFADMVERLQPAVVNISTKAKVPVAIEIDPFSGSRRPVVQNMEGGGSGFFISADGLIVTNNHVIATGPTNQVVNSITVTLTNGKEYKATLVGRDAASDLAVLKIDATDTPFVRFGQSSSLRAGDWVVAIGNPLGIGSTVTAGIISAVQRNFGTGGAYDRFLQTDTAINQGNSGGPLFDMNGNVVGINNRLLGPNGANIGLNFAIPSDQAVPVVDALRRGATPTRGYLGISLRPVDTDTAAALGLAKDRGEFIALVQDGQPAAKAGFKVGDVVTKVNGQEVTPNNTLSYVVSNVKPGTRIPIEIIRDGKHMTLNAVVGTRPAEADTPKETFNPEEEKTIDEAQGTDQDKQVRDTLGIAVQTVTPDIARAIGVDSNTRGVVVAAVSGSSDAARKGIRRGVVITRANGQPVTNAAELATQINAAKKQNRAAIMLDLRARGVETFPLAIRFND